ncbi:hypothetical protein [Methylophilus sp.]|uniref:hypothetical protein n=1 Tax=Methylophilus sp. TaxID=29541 RepID=UPI0011D6283D|nr:hypothetical protein [Methylophilus sp.]TXI45767.1 MAG: hypothetical protein E6Q52_05135 [Methylophilus sp.]
MSDSTKSEKKFNASNYAKDLTEHMKVLVAASNCSFRQGWAPIFERFISKVGRYPVLVCLVSEDHEFMDIEVDMGKTTRARYIYKEILIAKHESMRTCAHCGAMKFDTSNKFCKECNANSAKLKITGTWLDRY